jgi:hypothetical protein
VKPSLRPSPPKAPFPQDQLWYPDEVKGGSGPRKPKRCPTEGQARTSLADGNLLRSMDPNRPDLAQIAEEETLPSASQSETSQSDSDSEPREEDTAHELSTWQAPGTNTATQNDKPFLDETQATTFAITKTADSSTFPNEVENSSHTVSEPKKSSDSKSTYTMVPLPLILNSAEAHKDSIKSRSPKSTSEPQAQGISESGSPTDRYLKAFKSTANSLVTGDSTNPITDDWGNSSARFLDSPMQTSSATRSLSPPSRDEFLTSNQHFQSLPSFHKLMEGFPPPMTLPAQQSSTINRQYHPMSTFPTPNYFRSQILPSPVSTQGERSPQEPFGKQVSPRSASSLNSFSLSRERKFSQVSESINPHVRPPTSFSNPESYRSSDGYSSSTQPTPSDTGYTNTGTPTSSKATVTPTISVTQHVKKTSYRCEVPGCPSAPFATRYLLK